jgi:hypothetical protein
VKLGRRAATEIGGARRALCFEGGLIKLQVEIYQTNRAENSSKIVVEIRLTIDGIYL